MIMRCRFEIASGVHTRNVHKYRRAMRTYACVVTSECVGTFFVFDPQRADCVKFQNML